MKKKQKNIAVTENYIQDIISQSKLLEWAGISFNKTEWYKISIAMKVRKCINNQIENAY